MSYCFSTNNIIFAVKVVIVEKLMVWILVR